MNVTRQQYRAARRLFRQNGDYALQWMKPEVRLCITSTLVQPPLDQLECRAKVSKMLCIQCHQGITKSFIQRPFTQLPWTNLDARHAFGIVSPVRNAFIKQVYIANTAVYNEPST